MIPIFMRRMSTCSIPRCVVCKELELMRLFESESTGKKAVCGHGESAWEEQECPRAGRGKRSWDKGLRCLLLVSMLAQARSGFSVAFI